MTKRFIEMFSDTEPRVNPTPSIEEKPQRASGDSNGAEPVIQHNMYLDNEKGASLTDVRPKYLSGKKFVVVFACVLCPVPVPLPKRDKLTHLH
jgi:hypothetical protein